MSGKTARAKLHDLIDQGAHNWSDPEYKPLLSPARTAAWKFCVRNYGFRYTKRLGAPGTEYPPVPLIQGALWHAMAAAEDQGYHIPTALAEAAVDIRNGPTYRIEWSPTIDYLVQEMQGKWLRDYRAATRLDPMHHDIISVEKTYVAEWDKFIMLTIPDKVIRVLSDSSIWIVERKSTSRDDSGWHNKWPGNPQTTAEVVVVEKALGEPVAGVYIEPVVVTRKRNQTWDFPYPQPINNFTIYPWRAIDKTPIIRQAWLDYVNDVVDDMRSRDGNPDRLWAPNLVNCELCDYQPYCNGRKQLHDPLDGLIPLSEDRIGKLLSRERIAAGLSPTLLSRLAAQGALALKDIPDPAK